MKITKRQLKNIIRESLKEESLILEKDLSYLNPLKLFKNKGVNQRIKDFKKEVFEMLSIDRAAPYSKNKMIQFLGTVNREVASVIKRVYGKHADRNFLQNEVRKFHYLRVGLLEEFLTNAPANKKDEISAVGYIDIDNVRSNVAGRNQGITVAVELKGYVTLASNSNMISGHRPTPSDKENFANSGVTKDFYNDETGIPKNRTARKQHKDLLLTLTNQINYILDNIILDRQTFVTAEQRVKGTVTPYDSFFNPEVGTTKDKIKDMVDRGIRRTMWNEFVLDNWEPISLIVDNYTLERITSGEDLNPSETKIKNLAEQFDLKIISPLDWSIQDIARAQENEKEEIPTSHPMWRRRGRSLANMDLTKSEEEEMENQQGEEEIDD